MTNKFKKMLVTCALPYANGSIHLGHMLEHIQADIWVRYQKMRGNKVYFICADDSHGTPIFLKAQQLNISPKELISQMHIEHKNDFFEFNISYDNYHTTHSSETRELTELVYNRLKKNGFIKNRIVQQLYDQKKNMFLPDRLIKGICPKCNSQNQYGDSCEICGAVYNSIDLINPKSVISDTDPIIRKSEHIFLDLPAFSEMLYMWTQSGSIQKQVANKMKEWFKEGLKEWDISRDSPYFGFEVPDVPGQFFYVWLDAPIGYMGAFKNLCNNQNNTICFEEFWNISSTTDLYHFIGKDIIYFHSLFWPAILHGSNFRKPTNLFVHGYVTIHEKKMSKSLGIFIKARTYLKYLDSDCLRYYYASKLSSDIKDINLNLKNFLEKVNTDIVNKTVNLAARSSSFINKNFDGYLSNNIENPTLYKTFTTASNSIGKEFSKREYSRAIKKIMNLINLANRYIDEQKPWKISKQKDSKQKLQSVCSMGIQLFYISMIYLKPVLPSLANRVEYFLNTSLDWKNIEVPLVNHRIRPFKILFNRITESQITSIIEESKPTINKTI